MEYILEILKMGGAAAAGGGLGWLFHFRRRVARQGNELEGADFDLVSRTVKQAMQDLADLSERIGQLEKEKVSIMEEMGRLRKENETLTATLRKYIRNNNPNMAT